MGVFIVTPRAPQARQTCHAYCITVVHPPELTGGSVAVTQTLPAEALPWGFSSGRSISVHLERFKLSWFSITQMVLIVTKYLHCEIYQSRNTVYGAINKGPRY